MSNSKNILFAISLIMLFNYQKASYGMTDTKLRIETLKNTLKEQKRIYRINSEAYRFGRATKHVSDLSDKKTEEVLEDVRQIKKHAKREIAKTENELEKLNKLITLACGRCKEPAPPFKCARCKVPYCSEACQKAAWEDGHKRVCKKSK